MNNPLEPGTPVLSGTPMNGCRWMQRGTSSPGWSPDPSRCRRRPRFPGLPQRPIPLDELRDRLLDQRCPRATRDAVWRYLVRRARREGATWMVACVGMALPGLAGTASWLRPATAATAPTSTPPCCPVSSRHWQAWISAIRAWSTGCSGPHAALDSRRWKSRWTPRCPRSRRSSPAGRGRPTGIRIWFWLAPWETGCLTPTEADLISATRLGDESVTAWARGHNQSVHAVAKARERAEHRLADYLADPPGLAMADRSPTTRSLTPP